MEAKFVNIAIAVKDLDEAIRLYGDILGVNLDGNITEQSSLGVKTAMLRGNGFEFELFSPLTGEKTVTRFLETRGEGIYRLAYSVKDLDQASDHFKSKGVAVFEAGINNNRRVLFTHPKALKGVMMELVERRT